MGDLGGKIIMFLFIGNNHEVLLGNTYWKILFN